MGVIPFPLSSSPGIKNSENGGRLINAYAEKLGDQARDPYLWRRSPGLVQRGDSTFTHARGFLAVSGALLGAFNGELVVFSSGFTPTTLGALAGTKPVTFARNNVTPTPDIVCVTENGAFTCTTSGAPTPFADLDLPQPNSVTQLDGFFLWTIGDGRVFASDINAPSVSALSFTTAQSRPDGLLRGVAYAKRFWAFGQNSIEVYSDAGTQPFAFALEVAIPSGLAGTFAVAGWEEGWANVLQYVADDGVVKRLNGYTPVPVSSFDVNRAIASASDRTALEACVYMHGGHAIWSLTSPGEWTWEQNLTTGLWTERQSYTLAKYWRGSQSVFAFGKWLVGDRTTGLVGEVSETTYKEYTDPLVYSVVSGQAGAFANRIDIPRVDFDFVVGVGVATGTAPIQTDPVALIYFTDDAGDTWKGPYIRALGEQGNTSTRVTLTRQGLTGPIGRQYKIVVSDPVHVALLGAAMDVDLREK